MAVALVQFGEIETGEGPGFGQGLLWRGIPRILSWIIIIIIAHHSYPKAQWHRFVIFIRTHEC